MLFKLETLSQGSEVGAEHLLAMRVDLAAVLGSSISRHHLVIEEAPRRSDRRCWRRHGCLPLSES